MRRWKLWLAGAAAAAVLLAVGGPYVYANFIASEAPAPLSITTPSNVGSDSSGVVSTDGDWSVATGSQAGYRVKEVLNGQRVEAVGRTGEVTGALTISGEEVTSGSFTVDMASVATDSSMRDGQFRGRIMNTAQFPEATLTLDPFQPGAIPASGGQATATVTGQLNLHGVTKGVTFEVTAARTGAETFDVAATIPVVFADYGIANPSFGTITTEDNGVIEVLLHFARA